MKTHTLEAGQFIFGLFSQLLKLRFTAMVTYSFHLYSRSSQHFIQCLKFCWLIESVLLIGARTDIRNNAKQTPNDLARDPEVGRLLRGAVGR